MEVIEACLTLYRLSTLALVNVSILYNYSASLLFRCIVPTLNMILDQFWNCAEVRILPNAPTLMAAASVEPQRRHSKTIIGYYASWQWYDR